jgi:hypothetical protein
LSLGHANLRASSTGEFTSSDRVIYLYLANPFYVEMPACHQPWKETLCDEITDRRRPS